MSILVPGKGLVNLEAMRVDSAVREYDERLCFGFNEANQDWIIYVQLERGSDSPYHIDGYPVYPVLGFQDRIPTPDEALRRLVQSDALRQGEAILDRMLRRNADLQRERDAAVSDATAEVAERIEFEMRRQGKTEKYAKIPMSFGREVPGASKRNAGGD